MQAIGEMPGQSAGESLEAADVAVQDIQRLDGLINIAIIFGCGLIALAARNENLNQRKQEFDIGRGGFKAERIDLIVRLFRANLEIRPTQEMSQLFVAPAQIEDKGARIVLLQGEGKKIREEALAAAGAPGQKRVGYVIAGAAAAVLNALMQIEIKRGSICRFDNRQGLAIEKRIPAMALVQSEEKGPVGIVIVGDIDLPEIEVRIAGAGREKCRELVVRF